MTSTAITRAHIDAAAQFVSAQSRHRPVVGLVLGSGLSALADDVEESDAISYEQIPNWPVSTAPGHTGRLVIGKLAGQHVIVQQGRAHFYEGYSMWQITLPVRVMKLLGVETLILTNAAGGINRQFSAGDMMLIKDHLNFPGIAGYNPLRGPNEDDFGPRFPDLTRPYDPELRQLAMNVAEELGLRLHEGVYAYLAGPSYETPAELRFLQAVGADAVGMSTVPAVIAARHSGIRVLGISTITNESLLEPSPDATLSHDDVLATGKIIVPRLTSLIRGVLQRL